MNDDSPKTRLNPAKADERSAREARLNEALRENLKKRKQQGRSRAPQTNDAENSDSPKG